MTPVERNEVLEEALRKIDGGEGDPQGLAHRALVDAGLKDADEYDTPERQARSRALKSQPAEPAPTFEALVSRVGPLHTTGLASAEPAPRGGEPGRALRESVVDGLTDFPAATPASPTGGAATRPKCGKESPGGLMWCCLGAGHGNGCYYTLDGEPISPRPLALPAADDNSLAAELTRVIILFEGYIADGGNVRLVGLGDGAARLRSHLARLSATPAPAVPLTPGHVQTLRDAAHWVGRAAPAEKAAEVQALSRALDRIADGVPAAPLWERAELVTMVAGVFGDHNDATTWGQDEVAAKRVLAIVQRHLSSQGSGR